MNKKWYVVCKHAEGEAYGIVALTNEELEGAKKLINYEVVVDGSYCGGIEIYDDEPYNTEEEAREAAEMMAQQQSRRN